MRVEQLRLPDSAAWFAQNFDQGDAAKLAERYDRLFLEYTSCLEKTIESVCKVKGSEFVVSHRDARPKPAIRAGDKLSAIRPLRELSLGEEGAGPVVLKNGRFVEPLVPIYQVAPEYPIAVKTKHIEGVVVLRATVNKDGKVKKVELIAGHPLLIDAAIEAVKQWRYKPSTLGGNPIEVDTNVSVEFKLP